MTTNMRSRSQKLWMNFYSMDNFINGM